MYDFFVLHKSKIARRIDDHLQHELNGIELICDLFDTAIDEKEIIRHEIVLENDRFYMNTEQYLYPAHPPPYPLPLMEPYDLYAFTVAELRTMAAQLAAICPAKRISLIVLSTWLKNYAKHVPRVE